MAAYILENQSFWKLYMYGEWRGRREHICTIIHYLHNIWGGFGKDFMTTSSTRIQLHHNFTMNLGSQADSVQLIIVRQIENIRTQRTGLHSLKASCFQQVPLFWMVILGCSVLPCWFNHHFSFSKWLLLVVSEYIPKARASSIDTCTVVHCCVEEEKFFLCHNKLFGIKPQVSLQYVYM